MSFLKTVLKYLGKEVVHKNTTKLDYDTRKLLKHGLFKTKIEEGKRLKALKYHLLFVIFQFNSI